MSDICLINTNHGTHKGIENAISKGFSRFKDILVDAQPMVTCDGQINLYKKINSAGKYFTHFPYYYGNTTDGFSIVQRFDNYTYDYDKDSIMLQLYAFKESFAYIFGITLYIKSFVVVKYNTVQHYMFNNKCCSLATDTVPIVKLSPIKTLLDDEISQIDVISAQYRYTTPGFTVKYYSDPDFISSLLLSPTKYAHSIVLDILSTEYKKPRPQFCSKLKMYIYAREQWKRFVKLKSDVETILAHNNVSSYDLVSLSNCIAFIEDYYCNKLQLFTHTLDSVQYSLTPWEIRYVLEECGYNNRLHMSAEEKDFYIKLFNLIK